MPSFTETYFKFIPRYRKRINVSTGSEARHGIWISERAEMQGGRILLQQAVHQRRNRVLLRRPAGADGRGIDDYRRRQPRLRQTSRRRRRWVVVNRTYKKAVLS